MATVLPTEPPKSKKPSNSAFKQQRLPAWQPILTAGTVLPTFFVIGIAFIPVGIGLLYFSQDVKEFTLNYTDCRKVGGANDTTCADVIKEQRGRCDINCQCKIKISLNTTYKGDVYIYYGLTNFYQNHRRYVKSRDDNQLLGELSSHEPSTDCDHYDFIDSDSGKKIPIAPCGAIANSLFNDTFLLEMEDPGKPGTYTDVPLLKTGIAWPSDKSTKFRNPSDLNKSLEGYERPKNWCKNLSDLDTENPSNNGFENEDLIVWMRTAALPTFRKLHRRVNHTREGFRSGLPAGEYYLTINYNYPVTEFDGTKLFIISTTSLLGGKNPFLGVAYIVVGCICLVLGIIFLIVHIKWGKSPLYLFRIPNGPQGYAPEPVYNFLVWYYHSPRTPAPTQRRRLSSTPSVTFHPGSSPQIPQQRS